MSLHKILQMLEAEAEQQIAEIEQATQDEIEHIRAQAQLEAAEVRQKQLAAIQAPLQAEQVRILNQARLEALRVVMGVRETLITSALEATACRLANLTACKTHPPTGSTTYKQVLGQLVEESVNILGVDGRLRMRVRDSDVPLLEGLVQEMGLAAAVEGGLETDASPCTPLRGVLRGCLGGVVVTTSDGRISLANTLAGRLHLAATIYRPQIADLLCAEHPPTGSTTHPPTGSTTHLPTGGTMAQEA